MAQTFLSVLPVGTGRNACATDSNEGRHPCIASRAGYYSWAFVLFLVAAALTCLAAQDPGRAQQPGSRKDPLEGGRCGTGVHPARPKPQANKVERLSREEERHPGVLRHGLQSELNQQVKGVSG